MLDQRHRLWASSKSTLCRCVAFGRPEGRRKQATVAQRRQYPGAA